MKGPAVAAMMSPAMPLPPMPRTTTWSISPASGRPGSPRARSAAASTCSGREAVASSMPWESSAIRAPLLLEGGLDALGLGLGQQAVVLGVVDRLGLVDEHDRDVVANRVAPLQAGVVQAVLVLEVEQRALVLRAGEDLEQLGIQCHWRQPPLTSDSTSDTCASHSSCVRAS